MKGDRKLRLVPPGSEGAKQTDDEPPFTDEEIREAERTREALERGDEPVSSSLRAAHHPARLGDDDHDALIARALGDPLAPPTRAEAAMAARLRAELEAGSSGSDPEDLASVARALQAAWKPTPIPPLQNEALIARALSGRPGRRVVEIAAAVVGVLALAAGVALVISKGPDGTGGPRRAAVVAQASLIRARSTMDLFDVAEPFPRTGGETSRIDKIATARAVDLRANRYAAWGVK